MRFLVNYLDSCYFITILLVRCLLDHDFLRICPWDVKQISILLSLFEIWDYLFGSLNQARTHIDGGMKLPFTWIWRSVIRRLLKIISCERSIWPIFGLHYFLILASKKIRSGNFKLRLNIVASLVYLDFVRISRSKGWGLGLGDIYDIFFDNPIFYLQFGWSGGWA